MASPVGLSGLVGREEELAALDDVLARATGGKPAVVGLVGEPGIGKSRLLAELRSRAEATGWLVLTGRAAEFERDEPFGVFVDALDTHVTRGERQLLRRLGSETLADLAAMLPGLAQSGYATSKLLESERFRVHRAVRALLETLAAQQPFLLVLDDLHWADEASLELWGALVRRRPVGRLAIAGAFRPRQARRQLLESIGDDVVRIELGPLDAQTAKAMLAGLVDEAAAAALHRESGGVPFYLEQLARAPGGVALGRTETATTMDVPPAVSRALAGELDALSPTARELLRGAAVAGDPFDPMVAAATADVPEAQALTLLDELVAADLVRETGEPRRLRFRHPIVRHAVYESAGPGWRLAAHGRAAAALEAAGAPPLARAHHVAVCAKRGDQAAYQLLAEAAQAAASRAPGLAARWFGEALRLLPEDEPGWRLGLLGLRASSLAAAGRLEDSRGALMAALELAPPGSGEIRVRLAAGCAWAELLLGRSAEAEARLLGVLEELPDAGSGAAASVLVELAAGRLFRGDFAGVVDPAGRAREIAAASGDTLLAATATVLHGLGELGNGRMAEAQAALDAAARVVDAADDSSLAARIDTPIFYLGHLGFWAERYPDAARWFERGIAVSRLSGFGQVLVPLMTGQAHTLILLGRLDAADQIASATVDAARLTNNPHDLAWALWVRCWCLLNRGEVNDALRAGEESIGLVRGREHSNASIAACWAFGAALLETGEPERAVEVILETAGGPALPRLAPAARCIAYEVMTRGALADERIKEAGDWAARAELAASGLGAGVAASLASRARAVVALAQGDAAGAAESALRAAGCAATTGARIEEARARVVAGRALAAAGQRDRAAAELETARFALSGCDARRWRDEAARELRMIGRRVARGGELARGAGLGSLSRREREVAELVAAGRTNKQIAAALYISENTVESHLRRVFAKLEVTNRAALASAFAARTAQADVSPRETPV